MCGLEYLRAHDWNFRKALNRNLALFLLAPAGFLLYGLYLLTVRGNFLAMFSAYDSTKAWNYLTFRPNIFVTIYNSARETSRAIAGTRVFDNDITVDYAIPLLCLGLLLGCSTYLICAYRGKGIPLGIFGLCSIVFFTINTSLVAVHRYSLPCLTTYIALAIVFANYRRVRAFIASFGLAMLVAQITIIHMLYVTKDFVG